MVAFTNNGVYVISYTDVVKGTISIPKEALISDRLDITLIGKSRLEYGDLFDDNILHIMENFASFQDPSPPLMNLIQPDLSQVVPAVLRNPTEGQFWFNKGLNNGGSIDITSSGLYCLDNANIWNPIKLRGDITGNSGIIAHGQQIPLPSGVSSYAECSWFVSPQYVDGQSNYIACYADGNANVTALYRPITSNISVNGLANYIIIGNKTSKNHYEPIVSVTPTLTAAMVQSLTPTLTSTPTPTPAALASPTPTPTVAPTSSVTVTPTLTVTPTITRTITPSVTMSPTPSPITYQTFILSAAFRNASPGLNYVEFGTYHSDDGSINFGSISPTTYKGFVVGLECYSDNFIAPTLGFYIPGAPKNAFTQIQFVDRFGIFRTFTSASSTYNGNGFFTWSIPSILFDNQVQYTILVTP